jgi:hypothetical protein
MKRKPIKLNKYIIAIATTSLIVLGNGCKTTQHNNRVNVFNVAVVADTANIKWKSQKNVIYNIYWSASLKTPKWKKVYKVKGTGNDMTFIHPHSKNYNSGFYKIKQEQEQEQGIKQ